MIYKGFFNIHYSKPYYIVPFWLETSRRTIPWTLWRLRLLLFVSLALFWTWVVPNLGGRDMWHSSSLNATHPQVGFAIRVGFGCLLLFRSFWLNAEQIMNVTYARQSEKLKPETSSDFKSHMILFIFKLFCWETHEEYVRYSKQD